MSDKYPESWYHGHKHIEDYLATLRSDSYPVGVTTVRESLFELEIDIVAGRDTEMAHLCSIHDRLTSLGFEERPGANEDSVTTHRYEWAYDQY